MLLPAADNPALHYGVLDRDDWIGWNESNWRLKAEKVVYSLPGADYPRLSVVLYSDAKGRVRMPPLSQYLSVKFETSGAERPDRVTRQWLDVSTLFAQDLMRRKMIGRVNLPPGLLDARAFQWSGIGAEIRYTYMSPLPHATSVATATVRKALAKAMNAGYVVEQTESSEEVVSSLRATGDRKGFEYRLDETSVHNLMGSLDRSSCRAHVVRDSRGELVGGGIRLFSEGGVAMGWVQGTTREGLSNGAAQLIQRRVLDDASDLGAAHYDFGGANIRTVASAKASWGMQLTPYISLSADDARRLFAASKGFAKRALIDLRGPGRS